MRDDDDEPPLLSLFDADDLDLGVRVSDPDTSREAMAAFDREVMLNAVTLVIALYQRFGPMADFELKPRFASAWDRPACAHLYRQARSSARDLGRIRASGRKGVNPASNRQQVIWEACATSVPVKCRCDQCGHLLRRITPKVAS
jgi:hypothetical protein